MVKRIVVTMITCGSRIQALPPVRAELVELVTSLAQNGESLCDCDIEVHGIYYRYDIVIKTITPG